MSTEQYRSINEPTELLSELRRLLLAHHQADRLICRYMADLADGIAKWPVLIMGYGDVCELVRSRFGLSRRSIRERIRVGRALRELPALEKALMSGRLTYSRVREVTRVATRDTESLWLEVARRLPMRTLEERVSVASGEPRVRPRGARGVRDAGKVNLSISRDAWELLKRAMQAERTTSGLELTDEQALAAVANRALSHSIGRSNQVPAERPFAAEAGMTHGGSVPSTPPGGDAVTRVQEVEQSLSEDAQLLLALIRTGGSWGAGTLCEMTKMHPSRLASALLDLEFAHLVTRGMFGIFEAVQGSNGGGRFQNAG